jgi:hypothetical protein
MKLAVVLLSICMMNTQGHALSGLSMQDGPPPAAAQDAATAKGKRTAAAAEASTRKPSAAVEQVSPERVLDALRAVAKESRDWKNPGDSASMQAQIADLLWDADAVSARAFLIQAWDLTTRVEASAAESSLYRNRSPRTNSRREVILVARGRAPELAKKWLEEIAQDNETQKEKTNVQRGAFDDRSQRSTVLLQLALSGIEDNPQTSAELAMESLQDGISFGLQQVLLKLQEKKFELAQRVFNAALARLRNAGMLDPNELLILYSYLYTPGMVSGANTTDNPAQSLMSKGRNQPQVKAAAEVNPAMGLEFLKLASDLLVNAPLPATTDNPQLTARTQISVISVLQGKVSQLLPEQSLALQRRQQQLEADAQFVSNPQTAPPDTVRPLNGESREDFAQRRIERLEELARKETDPLRRDIAYTKAALATETDDYLRGVRIVGNIRDDELRAQLSDWLYARASLHFAQAGNPDKAYELLKKINDPLQRAVCLVVGAQKLVTTKDTLHAAQWLQEARASIKNADPNEASSQIALGIVSTYALFDNVSALDALTDAVKLINQSPPTSSAADKAPLVKRFSGFANADYTYNTNGFGLNSAVSAFSQTWFESVLDSLRKITHPELRARAILALCRKNLTPTKHSR